MGKLRLGTRGSKLALWQAQYVQKELLDTMPNKEIEIVVINTKGDKILDVALSKIGDKGLFTKEIENELLANNIDIAVHSMKDLPTQLSPGLCIGGVLKREMPNDVLISHKGYKFNDLRPNALIGTSSLRRIAQVKNKRPDIKILELRGNVDTRIKKMIDQDMDGIILAYAGVKRLGLDEYISDLLTEDFIMPAVGQGAIALEIRDLDIETKKIIETISHKPTFIETMAERAFLRELEGGCQIPIAASAKVSDGSLLLKGAVFSLDGKKVFYEQIVDKQLLPEDLGKKLAKQIKASGGDKILEQIKQQLGD